MAGTLEGEEAILTPLLVSSSLLLLDVYGQCRTFSIIMLHLQDRTTRTSVLAGGCGVEAGFRFLSSARNAPVSPADGRSSNRDSRLWGTKSLLGLPFTSSTVLLSQV